jgi:hypothetical protein
MPVDWQAALPDEERNNEQVLVAFARPINPDADFAVSVPMAQSLMRDALG